MKMNITELKAYHWLTEQGYKDIKFQGLKNPDFITASGDAFEVKKCRNNTVVFSNRQFDQLKNMPILSILVFNKGMEPVAIIPFNEIADSPKYWKGIRIYVVTMSRPAPREHMEGTVYTVEDVASILKVHVQTVYRWIYAHKLEAIRIPGFVRITEEQLNRFIGAELKVSTKA